MPKIKMLPSGSSKQQNHLNHQAIEDYLKTIYDLARTESPVSTSRLAEAREVKPASATSMIKRLAKLNLVNYAKHRGVVLTNAGKKLALEVIRHHRLLELYLIEALGFGWDEVHEQAEILEHVISEKFEDRIAAILNDPKFDPHGAPIPAKDGTIVYRNTLPLLSLPLDTPAQVARITEDKDVALLRYLDELGLKPNTSITVIHISPFDGPLTLNLNGDHIIVGYNIATTILVEIL